MEEYEKAVARVPKWKVRWAKDNLEFMIGTEDQTMSRSMLNSSIGASTKTKKKQTIRKQANR